MKRFLSVCVVLSALMFLAPAQACAQAHQVVFTWTLSSDDTTVNCTASANCAQALYRAAAACSAANIFAGVASGIAPTVTTYTDTTIMPGTWCYGLTFEMNGSESLKATVTVSLQPGPPASFAATSVK